MEWVYREIVFALSLPGTSWPKAITLASSPFLQQKDGGTIRLTIRQVEEQFLPQRADEWLQVMSQSTPQRRA